MTSAWGSSWGTSWGSSWDIAVVTTPAVVVPFINGPTTRRPCGIVGIEHTHISHMRGTDPVNVGGVSTSGYLGQHRQNTGHRVGLRRQGASLTGILRKHRQNHYYPALTEVPVVTGGGWILANGVWDDTGVWDDASVWKDAA